MTYCLQSYNYENEFDAEYFEKLQILQFLVDAECTIEKHVHCGVHWVHDVQR